MSDRTAEARRDLAFLKAVAEDRGPLPALLGWHLLAVGGVYGLGFVHIWGIFAEVFPWPESWRAFTWAPATIVYLPIVAWLSLKGGRMVWGPGARVFAAAWSGMAAMAIPILALVAVATARTGHPFYAMWPALAFILYGGAWVVTAIIRRQLWHLAVALGCFATGVGCGALIGVDAQWLVMAAGVLGFLALPGLIIVRLARGRG